MSEELDADLDHQYNHKPKTIAQLINTLPDVGTMPYEFRLQLKEVLYSLLDQEEKLKRVKLNSKKAHLIRLLKKNYISKDKVNKIIEEAYTLGLSRDNTINGTFSLTQINDRYDKDIKELKSKLNS